MFIRAAIGKIGGCGPGGRKRFRAVAALIQLACEAAKIVAERVRQCLVGRANAYQDLAGSFHQTYFNFLIVARRDADRNRLCRANAWIVFRYWRRPTGAAAAAGNSAAGR